MATQGNGKNQMNAQEAAPAAAAAMSEAPYSVNFLAKSPDGFEMQFTLRTTGEDELVERMEKLVSRLMQVGYDPIGRSYTRSESRVTTPRVAAEPKPEPAAENKPLFEDAWTGEEAEGEPAAQEGPAWCSIHNVEMPRHERDGEVWYSHRAKGPNGEYWCKGRPPRANR